LQLFDESVLVVSVQVVASAALSVSEYAYMVVTAVIAVGDAVGDTVGESAGEIVGT
jgi:hypothetical protein